MRLAEKYADTVSERYVLESRGQELMRDLDKSLEAGTVPSSFEKQETGNIYTSVIKEGDMSLNIGVSVKDGTYEVVSWRYEHDWVQNTDFGNLWTGND